MRKSIWTLSLFWILFVFILPTSAQDLITCVISAEAPLLRGENQAEYVGQIRLDCTRAFKEGEEEEEEKDEVRFFNLELLLNANITSDLTSGEDPDETEALLMIDDPLPGVENLSNGMTYLGQVKGTPGVAPGFGGGPGAPDSGNVYSATRVPGFDNRISWNGIPFVVPPLGVSRVLRIVNVRADMTSLPAEPDTPLSVTAFLAATPLNTFPIGNPQMVVGRVLPSLHAEATAENGPFRLVFEEMFSVAFKKRIENSTTSAASSRQQGVPEIPYFTESGLTPDFGGLSLDGPGVADTGTRFVAKFSEIPIGALITAPSSVLSTRGIGPGALELRRVLNFADDFSGGELMASGAATELVPVENGFATLLYEVVAQPPFDSVNGSKITERFEFPVPVIFGQPVRLNGASVSLSYAPLDPTRVASDSAPEPRFFNTDTGGRLFPIISRGVVTHITCRWSIGDPVPITRDRRFEDNEVISDSIEIIEQTGGPWLSASTDDTPTGEILTVAANPVGLPPGRYHSAVTLRLEDTPANLTVIPVILEVGPPPEINVDTSDVEFEMMVGGEAPEPQVLFLNARNKAINFTIVASTSSGGNWLSATPTSGGTPKNLVITADPTGLPPGTYEGAISVRSDTAVNSPQIIPVTLTIRRPAPFFTAASITNAASFAGGGVSPGEMVTFFGTLLGPEQPAGLIIGPDGRVATQVAGTQVLFDNTPAPIVAASSTQTTCIVPYNVAGKNAVSVVIVFQGSASDPVSAPVRNTWPGIFAADATGSGQGAILNQNGTINSPQNPADRGSLISIFITGAGQTIPIGDESALNNPANLPRPIAPVNVRVGGAEAVIDFVGGAPGGVAGFIQINARINANITPGAAVPVEVVAGGVPAQATITVAVQ